MKKASAKKTRAAAAATPSPGYRFRRKPLAINAVLFDGKIVGRQGKTIGKVIPQTCPDWFPGIARVADKRPTRLAIGDVVHCGTSLFIGLRSGVAEVKPGDWIIRGLTGELYPCKPDVFAMTYEKVEE